VADGTELGRLAKAAMDAGELVKDEIVLGMIKERLAKPDAGRGFVLDGYPRNRSQAEDLERVLAELGLTRDAAVLKDVDFDYRKQTAPLIEHYEQRGLLKRVDAEGTPDEVYQRLTAALGI